MEDFVARDVLGVVFHLTDGIPDATRINEAALKVLDAARIPVVLTDSDCVPFPRHSRYDVVGADDVDAGYRLTRHLLERGARRLVFFSPAFGGVSFANRCRGFEAAVAEARVRGVAVTGNSGDVSAVRALVRKHRPDAIICGNDRVAADMLASLGALGKRVPQDVLLAGFDDVNFARFVSPGLTTMHQPCTEIGRAAYETLLARVRDPDSPPRTVNFFAPLVVRASTNLEPRK
jgi:DNA-binding LacI/PurR family transcriptional regulator